MKKFFALLLTCIMALGATACGRLVEDDDKRPSIYISLFNGGYGREWLDTIVNDYNAEKQENKYKITIRASKDEFNTILSNLQSGTAIYDMFLTNSYVYKMIDANLLEDISDVWDSTPAGSDETIRGMMTGAEDYAIAYSDGKGGLYALPIQESVRGFVYDHELFLQYGLLYNDAGQFISSPTEKLSDGKDCKSGTYDDGQPETEAQWEAMARKAYQTLGYAFIYSGKFSNYLNDIYEMIAAQYDGVDAYMLNYTYDGQYDFDNDGVLGEDENHDNDDVTEEDETITIENGYRVAEMRGKLKALEFMDKYLACKDADLGITNPYTDPRAGNLSYSHTDAQTDFISKTAKNEKTKIGMLVEGDWWENESKMVFDDLKNELGYDDYAFRTHEYRFMTLPYFDGQKEEGSVYTIADNMYIGLKKQTDPEKEAICKDFMTYMFQPKYIQNFTVATGGVMPYDVELTEEQEAQLSPFSKNFLELYHDPANKFINPQLYQNKYTAIRAGLPLPTETEIGPDSYYIVMSGLYYYSAQEYYDGLLTRRTKDNAWQTYVDLYNNYIAARG